MTRDPLQLAVRMADVALSPTMKGAIEAERLKRQGIALVDLGAGEPDFPTPAHVIEAAHAALDAQFTKYTANMGIFDLREAVAERYRLDYGVAYAPDQVIVTAGGKQALYHAALALFGPGDEVVTHRPGWPTITEQIKLAGATPVVVDTDPADGFAITAARVLSAVTPRTRGIVLNSPNNPTGALLSESDARDLARAAERHGFWIVLDQCYEQLVFDGAAHNLPAAFAEASDRLVLCGSASKGYAMTGWRCGWLVGPRPVVQAANALQSHETSNVSSIAQKAALAALTGPQAVVASMRQEYQERRDVVLGWLAEEPRMSCTTPKGAFYLWPRVEALLTDRCPTTLVMAERLLHDKHVVVTPGEAFGTPGYLRLSFATSLGTLREGVTRLIEFVRESS